MNKQELLDQVQAAKDHLDEAAFGVEEIGNLISACAQLADVLEQVIPALEDRPTWQELEERESQLAQQDY